MLKDKFNIIEENNCVIDGKKISKPFVTFALNDYSWVGRNFNSVVYREGEDLIPKVFKLFKVGTKICSLNYWTMDVNETDIIIVLSTTEVGMVDTLEKELISMGYNLA